MPPRQRAEGDRRVEGPEGGGPDFAGRNATRQRQNANRVEVRQLALIGRHSIGRVALGEFDVVVAFAHGEREVFGPHVVLEVDEGFAGAFDAPERLGGRSAPIVLHGPEGCPRGGKAEFGEKRGGLARAVGDTLGQRRDTRRRSCQRQAPNTLGREEGGELVAPARLAAAMAGEVYARAVAARHQQSIEFDPSSRLALFDHATGQ